MNEEICMQFVNGYSPFAEPAHEFVLCLVKAGEQCFMAEEVPPPPGSAYQLPGMLWWLR